jgi:hypothetical protein
MDLILRDHQFRFTHDVFCFYIYGYVLFYVLIMKIQKQLMFVAVNDSSHAPHFNPYKNLLHVCMFLL